MNPNYAWYATDEATKAELIVSAFNYARTYWAPWIGVMTLWTIADPAWAPEDEQVLGLAEPLTARAGDSSKIDL